jgi:Family of unknown function (DUF5977)
LFSGLAIHFENNLLHKKYSPLTKINFYMLRTSLLVLLLVVNYLVFAQQTTNTDPNKTYINVNLPRTPESAGFEKYGNTSVSEFTGSPNISIPIYNLRGRFLEAPVSLSYHANGIKVSEEASWVGLGFDLNVGGRITVETKGTIDFGWSGLYSTTNMSTAIQKLFNRLSNSREVSVLTYGSVCEGCDTSLTHNMQDDAQAMWDMAYYGAGEPDIFRANFMGNSLNFYYDKISGGLKWLGEQSLFTINNGTDSLGRIINWTVVDNSGVTYYFNQKEVTTVTLPGSAVLPGTSTSAWLLTKIIHPSGDSILFTYANYGSSCPAFNISSSVNYVVSTASLTTSSDNSQNVTIQSPYYLTRMETTDAAVDFVLDMRTDIYGSGSRRLNKIQVSDKQTSTVVKTATFNYSYFGGDNRPCSTYLHSLSYSLPSPLSQDSFLLCSDKRLKLDSLAINDTTYQPPFRFYYNGGGWAPDKYSFAQDHWGYYNAVNNSGNGCSFLHLIPNTGLGTTSTVIPTQTFYAISRDYDSLNMQMMTLDSIVYPTGGSTAYIYEPHRSTMLPTVPVTGGGLRIKTIKNYALGNLTGITDYTYATGIYMGILEYHTRTATLATCSADPFITQEKQSSNGAINYSDILIGYPMVTITQRNQKGQINGYTIKDFNVSTPSYAGGGVGFDVLPAHWPSTAVTYNGNSYANTNTDYLYASMSGFAPTPNSNLEGKPAEERYFDSSGTLLKSSNYYYSLANYSNDFYDVRAIQNRNGGYLACSGGTYNDFNTQGMRPIIIFVSPAKSYHTLTDSTVEKTYQGSNFLTIKKTFKYNDYYQPEFITIQNSDSTQSISYTRTPLSFVHPSVPSGGDGDSYMIEQMKNQHVYDLPIEQVSMIKKTNGDSVVTGGLYNVYEASWLKKTYRLQVNTPLLFRTQFIPSYYYYNYPTLPSFYVNIDSRYKLHDSAEYYSYKLIKDLITPQGKKSFIWDSVSNNLLAQSVDAVSANTAYTSFETSATGNWSYSGSPVSSSSSPSGQKAYNLSNGNITKSLLDASKIYIVSYWSFSGQQTVSGSGTAITGRTIGPWTYYEHPVANPSGGTITVSGSGTIDELRLYPKGSLMTTYTYQPLIGVSTQCDPNNRISYYNYDGFGRLNLIRDQDKKILKQICYNYAGQTENCTLYTNADTSIGYVKNNCASGYVGNLVSYNVKPGTYFSTISKFDANQQALTEIYANGQANANAAGSCTACSGSFSVGSGWLNFYQSISTNNSIIYITLVIAGSGSSSFTGIGSGVTIGTVNSCSRPYALRAFSCSESGRLWSVSVYPDGHVVLTRTGGAALPNPGTGFTITGNYSL